MASANFTEKATECSKCTASSFPVPRDLVGWVYESPGRGTFGLISTSLVTIFLCTWVVIHPRVYMHEQHATLHKIALFLKAILAPEFIAVEGLQEWAQCRRMINDCAALTEGEFNFIHAFFVSMLALRYRTPQGDRVMWPNQYTWLLHQGLIDWKSQSRWGLSEDKIRDTSKADTAAKLITLFQVSCFTVQSILRTAHRLPLSQLESMTISYIPLFAVTYFFWWEKPKDIRTPSIVDLPHMHPEQKNTFEAMAVSNKFDDEAMECQATYWNIWYLTPRVFEKEAEDIAIQEASEKAAKDAVERVTTTAQYNPSPCIRHEDRLCEPEDQCADTMPFALPGEIVISHWDPDLYTSKVWPLICCFGASFGALHLLAWNTVFPTTIELYLWRISAFVSIFSMMVFMHFRKVVIRWSGPLTILSLVSPALYVASRIVMVGLVFAALRAEDPAVYDTCAASSYWMHIL